MILGIRWHPVLNFGSGGPETSIFEEMAAGTVIGLRTKKW